MVQAVVALGGNLGNVPQTFRTARARIQQHVQVEQVRSAGLYRSEAMGADAGDPFFNSVWTVETSLTPLQLLDLLQQVENESGRTREVHWGPRTLDLDLIFYGNEQISTPRLTVPHPHCWYRRFVMTPAESLVPRLVHPESGLTVRELSDRLQMNPFQLMLGGPSENLPSLKRLLAEFPGMHVSHVTSPVDVSTLPVSLAIWIDDSESTPLPPLWISARPESGPQPLRDIFTAACTELSQVPENTA